MNNFDECMTQFLLSIQPIPDGILGEIQRDAMKKNMPIISPETARLIRMLLSFKKPKKILEIGCAIGFSAGLMAQYLQEDGHITTIDRYDLMIKAAKRNFERLKITDKVTLLEGDAAKILADIDDSFDVVFLDAAKGQYIEFLPHCLRLLKEDGLFIVDDVLFGGTVAWDKFLVPRRQRTIHQRLRAFLKAVSENQSLETTILPIGGGVLISHKKTGMGD